MNNGLNGLYSPFCSQQVPGTPYLEVPSTSSPMNSNVPDIDDQTGPFRLPIGSKFMAGSSYCEDNFYVLGVHICC